jgi:hypothetical protein
MKCPSCGKLLTPANRDEDCPESLYRHGKHAIMVLDPIPIEYLRARAIPEDSL